MTIRRPTSHPPRIGLIATLLLVCGLAGACKNRRAETPLPKKTPETAASKPTAAEPVVPPPLILAERTSMYVPRPVLSFKVDIDECGFDVYLNGGLVTSNLEGIAHEEQPVNHWVRNGNNEIQLYLYKPADQPDKCNVKVVLTVTDIDNDETPPATVLVLAHTAEAAAAGAPFRGSSAPGTFDSHHGFRSSDKGDVRVGPVNLVHLSGNASEIHVLSRTFEVPLRFPEWSFFRGDKLKQWFEFESKEARRATYKEILGAYSKVWSLLQKRDVEGFLNACEERSREIDIAYYKTPGETRAGLRKQIESAMNDPKYELTTVENTPGKFWTYNVGSTGKLIALTQGERASPIFRYQLKGDTPFSLIFPVVFRKEGDKYIVTR
jgi:hypothetical protein